MAGRQPNDRSESRMRQPTIHVLRGLGIVAGFALAMTASGARAESTFGARTENPDGSAALTIGRRLSTDWESKVGTDIKLSAPGGSSAAENFLRGTPPDRSSGAVWGNVTMPGLAPHVWDKTSLQARIDAGQEQAKLGATLSRSVPIGHNVSLTLQNSYSVTHTLPDTNPATPVVPLLTSPLPANAVDGSASWAAGQSVRLDIDPSGTALSAGGAKSSVDEHWHNKLSVEQRLFGPLKVTTSVEDAGTAASKKSITAAFKSVW
jgi:hypothetical protein